MGIGMTGSLMSTIEVGMWIKVLLVLGSVVVALGVNIAVTVVTQSLALGFWAGGIAAFSLGWSAAKDGVI